MTVYTGNKMFFYYDNFLNCNFMKYIIIDQKILLKLHWGQGESIK